MTKYSKQFEVLWVDVDMNGHLQHTAYSKYATNVRVGFFKDVLDIKMSDFSEQKIGPIVMREFIEYRREVHLGDTLEIDMALAGVSENYTRWLIQHKICARGKTSCVINMEGAWLDLSLRKLASPGSLVSRGFDKIAKTKDFKIMSRRDRLSMSL